MANLRQFYGSNFRHRLREYTRLDADGLPEYGVSFSRYPKWGINPQPNWRPVGVWFYYLAPGCDSALGSGFATDRRFANVAKLITSKFLVLTPDDPLGIELFRHVRERAERSDRLFTFNRLLHEAGYSGILDIGAGVLPVEGCQGVQTWPDAAYLVESIEAPSGRATSEDQRFQNMLRRLRYTEPGSLQLNVDGVREILHMLPKYQHHWDRRDAKMDLINHLLTALDFTVPGVWEYVHEWYGWTTYFPEALERNPTTP